MTGIADDDRVDPAEDAEEFNFPQAEEFDPETAGKAEAKRALRAAEGDTESERAEQAAVRKREELSRLTDQLTDAKRRRQQFEARREALAYAIERLDAADDDQLVMQRLEGGVSISVPADERESVREDLREQREQLDAQLDDLEAEVESIEREVERDRVAFGHLQSHYELATDD